jgi:hypothetical protein
VLPETRFYNLTLDQGGSAGKPDMRALEAAKGFVEENLKAKPAIGPIDLLDLSRLKEAIKRVAKIQGWLPVKSPALCGYVSWLTQLGKGKDLYIAVDGALLGRSSLAEPGGAGERAKSKFLAVIGHEVGHVKMRKPGQEQKFIRRVGSLRLADPQTLLAEAEAWLFAGFLRAFVFADIASTKRPDECYRYV